MQRPLLLLHGAIGASDQLRDLADSLVTSHNAHLFDFPGHGGSKMPEAPFSIPSFAAALLDFIKEKGWDEVAIFGYSMGGYVALYLAKYHPDVVHRVITLGTKFYWDEAVAAKEVQMLDPGTIAVKVPAFAESLEQRHHPNDWKDVLQRTAGMMLALGRENTLSDDSYKTISKKILLLLGDRDKMVSLEETLNVYRSLPEAQLGILPGTPHPIEKVDVGLLDFFIRRFLNVGP